ncbi:hypothetical protein AB0L65_25655 [Nonomuraea sp. NPDC052116]|uniref:hypothetical protein n=1 Tax=Nonomuraea sp. NPDC052116 TaxID=3155665 RepID=UPI00343ABAD3
MRTDVEVLAVDDDPARVVQVGAVEVEVAADTGAGQAQLAGDVAAGQAQVAVHLDVRGDQAGQRGAAQAEEAGARLVQVGRLVERALLKGDREADLGEGQVEQAGDPGADEAQRGLGPVVLAEEQLGQGLRANGRVEVARAQVDFPAAGHGFGHGPLGREEIGDFHTAILRCPPGIRSRSRWPPTRVRRAPARRPRPSPGTGR